MVERFSLDAQDHALVEGMIDLPFASNAISATFTFASVLHSGRLHNFIAIFTCMAIVQVAGNSGSRVYTVVPNRVSVG